MILSIIIPVYNSAATIIESIDSVVHQCAESTYSWELILVDDGSKDTSAELIETYIAQSPAGRDIRLIRQSNGGAATARNTGLRVAKGEFIAFNDSDDRWIAGKLSTQMDFMVQNPEIYLLGCNYGHNNMTQGSPIKLNSVTRIGIKTQVLKNYFFPPTVLFRSAVIGRAGLFNEQLRYAEEGYFFNNIVYHFPSVFMNFKAAESITNKNPWGESGLSGNLVAMEKGELFNIRSAYRFKYISLSHFILAYCFSAAKFMRRLLISAYRRSIQSK